MRPWLAGLVLALLLPLAQARTFVVEGAAAQADDAAPGTPERPLRTIGAALRQLQPGDEVVVGDGVYRETLVVPPLAPADPATTHTTLRARMPGAAVVRGSEPVAGWRREDGERWSVDWSGKPEPQQVFVDGRPLRQVAGTVFGGYPTKPGHELAAAHRSEGGIWRGRLDGDAASMPPDSFFHDAAAGRLLLRLAAPGDPARALVEVSTRRHLLLAEQARGLVIDGLVFEHASTSTWARQGAVKVFGSFNTLHGVTVRDVDAIGLQFFGADGRIAGSRFERCGQLGLNARGRRIVIEDNQMLANNTRGFNKWWEAGGIKIIGEGGLHDSTLRGNVAAFNSGDGIWIDWKNTGIRIEGNVAAYNSGFGIHYEASQDGLIAGNASYGNGQRGIYLLESARSRVERNVVVGNGLEGIAVADGQRSKADALLKPRDNEVRDNVLGWNRGAQLQLPDAGSGSRSQANVFLNENAAVLVQGWTSPLNRPASGLADWQSRSRMDAGSRERRLPMPPALKQALAQQRLLSVDELRRLLPPADGAPPSAR